MTAIDTTAAPARSTPLSAEATAFLGIALFVALVALATLTWGLPGLAMSALVTVPVIYTVLLLITVGK